MYKDSFYIIQEYRAKGYRYLGWVNTNENAYKAYRESKDHESIVTGNCLRTVLLHDLKAIVEIDSGD